MLNIIPRKIKKIGTIILTTSGLLLGFVWSYLEKVLPIATKQELSTIYLVQIGASGIIIIVALVTFCMFLLAFIIKKSFAPEKQTNEIKQNITEPQHKALNDNAIKILQFLWKQKEKMEDKEISQALSIDVQNVKFHLEDLEKQKMVHGTIAMGQPRLWSIIQDGREYLMNNKLIS